MHINKLLIYETTHFENISALLKLSNGHFTEVTVFIYDEYYPSLQSILGHEKYSFKVNWICKKEKSNRSFIKYFFTYLKKYEFSHFHINTLDHNLLFFAAHLLFCKRKSISMTVHSINTYKRYKFATLKDISESVAKLILHRKINHYRVLAPAMVNYFSHKFPFKKVCFIPGSFYKKVPSFIPPIEEFLIVVPGTISEKRRNYTLLLNLFIENIRAYTSKTNIHLILAGSGESIYGRKIIQGLHRLSQTNPKFKITSFFEHLSQEAYEQFYRCAHIILAPIQASTKSMRNEPEINGITHSPGFITDEIYMGKPAIVPADIEIPDQFQDCFWRYASEQQLNEILSALLNNPMLIDIKEKQIDNACKYFKSENFENEFETIFISGNN